MERAAEKNRSDSEHRKGRERSIGQTGAGAERPVDSTGRGGQQPILAMTQRSASVNKVRQSDVTNS
jgi:hypothetical protein